MDRQTLANYGWIVTVALILAVMLALATPFGKYVMDGVSSIASGYINTSNEAMSDANKNKLVAEWEDKWLSDRDNDKNTVETLVHTKVAKNATYIAEDGKTYTAGEEIPTPQYGDIYRYGNYEYCYGINTCSGCYTTWAHKCCYSIESYEWDSGYYSGWVVKCMQDVANPGQILEIIGGKNVVALADYAFCYAQSVPACDEEWCCGTCTYTEITGYTNLTEFTVPENVSLGWGTFYNCNNLTKLNLPSNITSLSLYSCTGIKELDLSNYNNLTYLYLQDCSSLSDLKLPSTLKSISNSAFMYCDSLKELDLSHTQITEIGYNAFQGSGIKTLKLPTTLKYIRGFSFYLAYVDDIYYTGTSSQWASIINSSSYLMDNNPTIHYNYTPTR